MFTAPGMGHVKRPPSGHQCPGSLACFLNQLGSGMRHLKHGIAARYFLIGVGAEVSLENLIHLIVRTGDKTI
jgi:hypothetical protein